MKKRMIEIINGKVPTAEPINFAIRHVEKEWEQQGTLITLKLMLIWDRTIKPQGYRRRCIREIIYLYASDEAGMMYAILDLGKEIGQGRSLISLEDREVTPYLMNRGIKLNIPLDARTPSYSDASDSAVQNIRHMWEYEFWTELLDRMAVEHYNVLSLWTLSPFPSLVKIPEYPLTALQDVKRSLRPAKADLSGWGMYSEDMEQSLVTVKKLSIEEKIAFWQSIMEYAKNRCIKIMIFTWNLFVYGTEHTPYGITCDQSNPVTRDYIYYGTRALMDTYPLLAGIGVTSGEHMRRDETDIPFLADTYGRAVRDYLKEHPERDFEFIHRMQYTRYDSIMEEFKDFPCPFGISFKYSQAHMYSGSRPAFIRDFLQEKNPDIKIWLTVRNDDFYMYRWGDPAFALDYLKGMPAKMMKGFYMGADGYTWGRDYISLKNNSHPLVIARMWYMFSIWGQLSYNIKLSEDFFRRELELKFGAEYKGLYEAWKSASLIIPIVNQVHWHDYDFQWYPEGCCMYDFETDKLIFADINEFVTCPAMPGGEYLSVEDYCEALLKGEKAAKKNPIQAAASIRDLASRALAWTKQFWEINNIKKQSAGENDIPDMDRMKLDELKATVEDMEALSYLGQYYADKLEAAMKLCLYRKSGDRKAREEAVALLREAALSWAVYSAKSKSLYKPQLLTRLCGIVDVQRFDNLAELDVLYAEYET
jgi:hypothetical protein